MEMPHVVSHEPSKVKTSPAIWIAIVVFLALAAFVFDEGIVRMVRKWAGPELGHSYFIPLISLYLVWQKRKVLAALPRHGSWAGLLVVLLGLMLFVVGELSTLFVVVQYAFLITLCGFVLAMVGWRVTLAAWAPLLILFFMIPLPDFLYQELSTRLQLISSELGAALIRALGISVFVEGNVIDLGVYKLQVVEACNGLRYLFPLTTIAFIMAYFYKASLWKRAVIFFSSIPVAILMNSIRIGVIGVLVEFYGTEAAEGFLHFFEGWVVFMLCIAILLGEMWILGQFGGARRSLSSLFHIETERAPAQASPRTTTMDVSRPAILCIVATAAVAVLATTMTTRAEEELARAPFSRFPLALGPWSGDRERLEQQYIDVLKFDDYAFINYDVNGKEYVNLYIAYYASQRKGQSAHSPRTCIPGGGWEITSLTEKAISPVDAGDPPLVVNRAMIQRGREQQLVYYWFKQRDRNVTNEFAVKWYLLWDAMTRNRTDGALIRLTTFVEGNEGVEAADRRLTLFARDVANHLDPYVPG